jgi:N-acylglucosamine 2-epimerase
MKGNEMPKLDPTPENFTALRGDFEKDLLESVVPFWEKFSPDREFGGYLTCLDRDGTCFDTDKFTWMQGRELWCFSHLFATVEQKPEWLELARLGADFLNRNGRADDGDYYFSLDRQGKPLVEPYNIFSDCFCAAGFAEYGKALKASRAPGEDWATAEALRIWERIQVRKSNPKGVWTKQIAGARPVRAMAIPMIQLWLASVFRGIVPDSRLDAVVGQSIRDVATFHLNRDKKAVFERSMPDGSRPQGMEGRLLSPGHALETLLFILDAMKGKTPAELAAMGVPDWLDANQVVDAMLWSVERGWDEVNGGIFYYRDYEGFPTEKLEAAMKLWWVHAEALCAFVLAYKVTGRRECWDWFVRIKEWTWQHFIDPEFGEWYGYLDEAGKPAFGLKGGKWKGMFHTPRALLFCARTLATMGG